MMWSLYDTLGMEEIDGIKHLEKNIRVFHKKENQSHTIKLHRQNLLWFWYLKNSNPHIWQILVIID